MLESLFGKKKTPAGAEPPLMANRQSAVVRSCTCNSNMAFLAICRAAAGKQAPHRQIHQRDRQRAQLSTNARAEADHGDEAQRQEWADGALHSMQLPRCHYCAISSAHAQFTARMLAHCCSNLQWPWQTVPCRQKSCMTQAHRSKHRQLFVVRM